MRHQGRARFEEYRRPEQKIPSARDKEKHVFCLPLSGGGHLTGELAAPIESRGGGWEVLSPAGGFSSKNERGYWGHERVRKRQ